MDSPTGRMIKIGTASIGLINLDIALNKALAEKMNIDEATAFVFDQVKSKNYIPTGLEKQYRQSIGREYKKLLGMETGKDDNLVVRIFGTGCVVCNSIHTMVIDAMMRAGVAADIEMIDDPDEIGRHGIQSTPAIMINDQVKIAGSQPTPAQLEEWLINP